MQTIAVTEVTTVPFKIPLREPLRVAIAEFDSREHVLVTVLTDAGIVGVGEAVPRWMSYGETQASVVEVIDKHIGPAMLGMDPFDRNSLRYRLRHLVGNNCAKAAVDIALWDIIGKAVDEPVWRLLGGSDDPVRVAALIGFLDPGEAHAQALAWRDDYGITAFKIKVGRDPVTDADTCCAIRDAIGADGFLYADANQAFSAEEAWRFLQLGAKAQLAWIEDPVSTGDAGGRRWLGARSSVPVAGDGNCRDLDQVRQAVLSERCRVVSMKVARSGFTESQKIAAFCDAMHVVTTLGSQGDTGIGVTAGLHFATTMNRSRTACELVPHLGLRGDLTSRPPVVEGGALRPPVAPGLGIDIDSDALARYAIQ